MAITDYFTWRGAILKSNLPATTRHVLLTLGCHMNDVGESCYPSIDLLCQETGLSNRAVITHLQKANEFGWIQVGRHGFGDSRYWRNEYKISWPSSDDFKDKKDTTTVNVVHQGLAIHGERGAPTTVNDVHTSTSCNSSVVSTSVETTQRAREDSGVASEIHPNMKMVQAILPLGVTCTSMNPTLQQWVNEKIPIEFVAQCVAIARLRKPAPEKIAVNYLDAIIRSEMKPKKPSNGWVMSDEATMQKGAELGIDAKTGESMCDYRQRLRRMIEGGAMA